MLLKLPGNENFQFLFQQCKCIHAVLLILKLCLITLVDECVKWCRNFNDKNFHFTLIDDNQVSPKLSSGRDKMSVIQMSVRREPCAVRRAPSAVRDFLSGAFLGNRMPYLDDIWYVGGVRA